MRSSQVLSGSFDKQSKSVFSKAVQCGAVGEGESLNNWYILLILFVVLIHCYCCCIVLMAKPFLIQEGYLSMTHRSFLVDPFPLPNDNK